MRTIAGVILTTFNFLDNTKKCLKSFFENTTDYELVVVDNNSTDGTQEFITNQGLHLITFDHWVGISEALNAGIRYFLNQETPEKKYNLCWIHNDMTFYPNWLPALSNYLEKHIKCGRVASHNMRDPLAPERAGNELPFLIRGSVFKEIGMFDERYKGTAGKEDWDMNNRILDHGYSIMITPESKVLHTGAVTRSGLMPKDWENFNNALYFSKFGTDKAKI